MTDASQTATADRMHPVQLAAVGICLLLNLIDGFDVLAMAFTAPAIAREWQLGPDRLGLLFGAGMAGMAAGALLLSPLADIVGRRRTIMACLAVVVTGMVAAAAARSAFEIGLARVVTGLGIGAIISSIGAMAYEFSSDRARGLVMGLMAVCFPAGAVLGGSLSLALTSSLGWRSVFLTGAIVTALAIPLVALLLAESPAFLMQSRHPDALARANAVRGRMGQPPLDSLPATDGTAFRHKVGALFGTALRPTTLSLAALFFLVMLSFYFIINWAPKLVVMMGGGESSGILAGLLLNLGGMAGGLGTGIAITRFGLTPVSRAAIGGMAMAIALFGLAAGSGSIAITIAPPILGFAMFATMACIYMLLAARFPARVRATAAGFISTAGRLGSVLGPMAGGYLLAGSANAAMVCAAMAIPALCAALLVRRPSNVTN